jgi:hypothetical protein
MKTFGRMAGAAAASLALVLTPMGIASATSVTSAPIDRRDDDRRDDDRITVTLTPEQRTTVLAARSAYLTSAAGIRTTYGDAVAAALKTARATTQPAGLAYEIAKDAYVFTRATGGDATAAKAALDTAATTYKAALQAARTASKPALDEAKSVARTALEKARTDYVGAVTSAVPNAPQSLLVPPGHGKSWVSQGFGKDFGRDWNRGSRR